MKRIVTAFAIGLQAMALCPAQSTSMNFHVHRRAAAAADRVRPALERDLANTGLKIGDPVFIRVFKKERQLELFVRHRKSGKFQLFRSYPIAAASGGPGPKLAEGDCQVPEGFYSVPPSAMNPDSRFHLAFNIGFPNTYDHAHGRTGSLIMIHGGRVSTGCLAMTDGKMEEIFTLCAAAHAGGQPFFRVHLFPFRMTAEHLRQATGSEWLDFWQNLREGYDWFETKGVPPDTTVKDSIYRFSNEAR